MNRIRNTWNSSQPVIDIPQTVNRKQLSLFFHHSFGKSHFSRPSTGWKTASHHPYVHRFCIPLARCIPNVGHRTRYSWCSIRPIDHRDTAELGWHSSNISVPHRVTYFPRGQWCQRSRLDLATFRHFSISTSSSKLLQSSSIKRFSHHCAVQKWL